MLLMSRDRAEADEAADRVWLTTGGSVHQPTRTAKQLSKRATLASDWMKLAGIERAPRF
jgi:hypothetical protein